MNQDAAQIVAQQMQILAACTQPPFTSFQWPVGFVTGQDSAAKKEVCHVVANHWSMHSRQLYRFVSTQRADLKTSVQRMQASQAAWETSRGIAGYRINAQTNDLDIAIERFINHMSNLTVTSLGLDISRTRARAQREENLEEIENHLMSTIDVVNTNLDTVSGQMELLKEAVSQYNFLNPMVEPDGQQPQAQADPQAPPPGQAREQKFETKYTFLSHK